MNCGKLTAKLRDMVPVVFIEEGREAKRIKNIEIPDEIKELEFKDFKFDVSESGKITFKIWFERGTLPEVFPEARTRRTRKPKTEEPTVAESEVVETVEEPAVVEPETMELVYDVHGAYRKQMVADISGILEVPSKYNNAPTFSYTIGDYTVDKMGTVTGPYNARLIERLKHLGFNAK